MYPNDISKTKNIFDIPNLLWHLITSNILSSKSFHIHSFFAILYKNTLPTIYITHHKPSIFACFEFKELDLLI